MTTAIPSVPRCPKRGEMFVRQVYHHNGTLTFQVRVKRLVGSSLVNEYHDENSAVERTTRPLDPPSDSADSYAQRTWLEACRQIAHQVTLHSKLKRHPYNDDTSRLYSRNVWWND